MRAALAILALAAAAVARADAPPARLEALFPHEADVHVTAGGLARLELPAAVLAACRADLSDVRVFDRDDREVPFVVDAGAAVGTERRETTAVAAAVLDLRRSETPREGAPARVHEEYRLAVPADPGPWDLVLETRRSGFVRALRATGDDGTVVTERAPLIRLGDPAVDRLRVALPALAGASIVVAIDGEEGFWLEPAFRFERTRALAPSARLRVPMVAASPARTGDRTVLEVARPAGVVPQLVRIDAATPAFDRRVQVWDVRPGQADARVGDGRVLRVTTATDVVEQLEVVLAPARGPRLRVEILDGDSPPLAGLAVTAVVPQPTMIFALPGDGPRDSAGTLRFGGGRAFRPRYDLAALPPALDRDLRDVDAGAAVRLYDPARLAVARLGPVRPNPAFDAAPALGFALRAGAAVDARRFAYRRPLVVPPSPDGIARLDLAPDDLARARLDLGDVRVVDAEARQWPFLVDRAVPPASLPLVAGGPRVRDRRSRWTLALPSVPLPVAALELDVDLPFFHRPFALEASGVDGTSRVVASGTLSRDAGRVQRARVVLAPQPVAALDLVVEDGDEAPLPLRGATAEIPRAVLLLAAPAGRYDLLLGAPDLEAPRYELAQVRDVVLAVEAPAIEAGAAGANPAFSAAARLAAGDAGRRAVVWAVLVGAVAALGVLTLRAARRP